jgi:protocatechuate 3,4-dioxygenase beta subunit
LTSAGSSKVSHHKETFKAMQRAFWTAMVIQCLLTAASVRADAPDKFTPPPGEETEQVKTLMARADSALQSGKSTTDILVDPDYLPAHEWPRFRKLIREHARSSRVVMVCPDEPGVALIVTGAVLDQAGKAIEDAELYAYQTSAKGWYSDRAAHVAAHEGDRRHARLFGYLRTDDSGRFELRTIRPAGYPGSDLPAHIHIEVGREGKKPVVLVTEVQFDDDPRLTPEMRARSKREGLVISSVRAEAEKSQRVEIELKTR